MMNSDMQPSVFLAHIRPAYGVAPDRLEHLIMSQSASFAIPSRPWLAPELLSHRILRAAGNQYLWEIAFDGCDLPDEDHGAADSIEDAVFSEVRARLSGIGEVTSSVAYADMSLPSASADIAEKPLPREGPVSFEQPDDGLPEWEAYADGSGAPEAGLELPQELLAEIEQSRAGIPVEPGLKAWSKGHVYAGNTDKSHIAYLAEYLESRSSRASSADRRRIRAFRAFQAREGSTAAINTYDNQIVTWGTGWGGLGLLGKVMQRAVANPAVRELFRSVGLRYRGKNVYDVVDLEAKLVVTGTREALEAIRRSVPLLHVLIHAARAPATRDAVTDAQLMTFFESAANIPKSEAVSTQALFNFIAHLKHWAPAYVMSFKDLPGCLEWALPQAGDASPSAERDHQLAVLVGRYFYGAPRHLKLSWIPDWKQFQLYGRHMKEDGLDCLNEPFYQASGPPAGDPFAAAQGVPAYAPASQSRPAQPRPSILKNAPLAGQAELERIAGGKGALRKGAKGAAIKTVQEALMALKYAVRGGADGIFGPGLEDAVEAFQKEKALAADGIVGPGTLKALDAALGAVNR